MEIEPSGVDLNLSIAVYRQDVCPAFGVDRTAVDRQLAAGHLDHSIRSVGIFAGIADMLISASLHRAAVDHNFAAVTDPDRCSVYIAGGRACVMIAAVSYICIEDGESGFCFTSSGFNKSSVDEESAVVMDVEDIALLIVPCNLLEIIIIVGCRNIAVQFDRSAADRVGDVQIAVRNVEKGGTMAVHIRIFQHEIVAVQIQDLSDAISSSPQEVFHIPGGPNGIAFIVDVAGTFLIDLVPEDLHKAGGNDIAEHDGPGCPVVVLYMADLVRDIFRKFDIGIKVETAISFFFKLIIMPVSWKMCEVKRGQKFDPVTGLIISECRIFRIYPFLRRPWHRRKNHAQYEQACNNFSQHCLHRRSAFLFDRRQAPGQRYDKNPPRVVVSLYRSEFSVSSING